MNFAPPLMKRGFVGDDYDAAEAQPMASTTPEPVHEATHAAHSPTAQYLSGVTRHLRKPEGFTNKREVPHLPGRMFSE
jgi:hypothetical protein